MAQFTPAQIDEMFDPTRAPAWDRVNVDDQQAIEAVWEKLRQVAHFIVETTPDDDTQSPHIIESQKEAAMKAFDAIVEENLNETPVIPPNDEGTVG